MLTLQQSIQIGVITISTFFWWGNVSQAQITPDNTLGSESSVITNVEQLRQHIDGGAIRGTNLFHSFLEFNVGEGRSVYFSNPSAINNIFSRITGGNASHILGRLGVLGGANLFLINPNGIIFGANSSLDIQGSFFATTADGIKLGENGFFSATEPEQSNLLSVSPSSLFFKQAENHQGSIINRGTLTVKGDLTLVGGNLDLQGQLYSGGNLTLQGLNSVTIRDTNLNPFVAVSAGNLLIQGNQSLDIFALNHPQSSLVSGGNMTLRSANTVAGDAHYWSGGSFQIEQLDGSLGNLRSPNDPIIKASGNVSFKSYTGASLHILAGGNVEIDNITINGVETTDYLQETVTLSDGVTTVTLDGSKQPTLDIRAGTTAVGNVSEVIGTPIPDGLEFSPNGSQTANIKIGQVNIAEPNGLVFITNQYQPNLAMTGTIEIGQIYTNGYFNENGNFNELDGDSGSLIIDSRNSIIFPPQSIVSTLSLTGNGGDIHLIAQGTIALDQAVMESSTYGIGKAGDIKVNANALVMNNGASLTANTLSQGQGGDITVNAAEKVELTGLNPNDTSFPTGLFANVWVFSGAATGNAGDINITTPKLIVQDGAEISTTTFSQGNAGNITVNASESIEILRTPSNASLSTGLFAGNFAGGSGNGGNITLNTQEFRLEDSAEVATTTFSQGNAGNITINASESIRILRTPTYASLTTGLFAFSNGNGDGGDITLNTQTLSVEEGAEININTFGQGSGGELMINASESIELVGVDGSRETALYSSTLGSGDGGNLTLNTKTLVMRDGAFIFVSSILPEQGDFNPNDLGQSGNLTINASESIDLIGTKQDSQGDFTSSGLFNDTSGAKDAGTVTITTPQLRLQDGATIDGGTFGIGNGGDILIFAEEIEIVGASPDREFSSWIRARSTNATEEFGLRATGDGGNITINTQRLSLLDGGQISVSTFADGNAGTLTINASEAILISGFVVSEFYSGDALTSGIFAQTALTSTGDGGSITLNTPQLTLSDGAVIFARTSTQGQGGAIEIYAPNSVNLDDNTVITVETRSAGKAGDILITSDTITIGEDAQLSATATETSTNNEGGGSITLNAQNLNISGQLGIFAETQGQAPAGNLTINPNNDNPNLNILFTDNGFISARTTSAGEGGDISITAPQTVDIRGIGKITVETLGSGNAGIIEIISPTINLAEGLEISASTSGIGDAGSIIVPNAININLTQSEITASTSGEGNAGDILINSQTLTLDNNSAINTTTNSDSTGKGGNITIQTTGNTLTLNNRSQISSRSQGQGDAGNININSQGDLILTNSEISTSSEQASGGEINLSARNIRLQGNGDIRTNVNSGAGGGGDITLKADSILAFNDSDILAFARDGSGGNITIDTSIFFAEGFQGVIDNLDLDNLDGNGISDVNASGAVSGSIVIPDLTFIRNSLVELPQNIIETDKLLANSCVVPNQKQTGTFIITGSGGLPQRLGDPLMSPYSTGEVRPLPSSDDTPQNWQHGDPVIEPQGVYRLPNGQMVLSRPCEN